MRNVMNQTILKRVLPTTILATLVGVAFAGDNVYWKTGVDSGDWNVGSSWRDGSVPQTGDHAYVDVAHAVEITMEPNTNAAVFQTFFRTPAWTTLNLPVSSELAVTWHMNVDQGGKFRFTSGTLNLQGDGLFMEDSGSDYGYGGAEFIVDSSNARIINAGCLNVPNKRSGSTFAASNGAQFVNCSINVGAGVGAIDNTFILSGVTATEMRALDMGSGSFNKAYVDNTVYEITDRGGLREYEKSISLGRSVTGCDNMMLIAGGSTFTNLEQMHIGEWGSRNTLTVSNSTVQVKSTLNFGNNGSNNVDAASDNLFTLADKSSLSVGGINFGGEAWGDSGRNRFVIDGSTVTVREGINIGSKNSSNRLEVINGGHLQGNGGITVGSGNYNGDAGIFNANGNVLYLDGSTVTIASHSGLTIGDGNGNGSFVESNALIAVNDSIVSSLPPSDNNGLTIGNTIRSAGNYALFSNSTFLYYRTLTIGMKGSHNRLIFERSSFTNNLYGHIVIGKEKEAQGNAMIIVDSSIDTTDQTHNIFVGEEGGYSSLVMTNSIFAHTNLGYGAIIIADNVLSTHNSVSLKDSTFIGQNADIFKSGGDNQLILDNSNFLFPFSGKSYAISQQSSSTGNSITFRGTNSLFSVTGKLSIKNDTRLVFEIPVGGYVQAPLQVEHIEFYVDGGVTVNVSAKQFGLQGGGDVPLVHAPDWTDAWMQTLYDNASFIDGNGEFYFEGTTLMVHVINEGATMIKIK